MDEQMDGQAVRQHGQAHCETLLAGDIGRAAEEMSRELRSNLGPIVARLPMPLTEATIESVEMTKTRADYGSVLGFHTLWHIPNRRMS